MMKNLHYVLVSLALIFGSFVTFGQIPPNLGSAASFALFTSSLNVSNTGGGTTVTGDIGTNSGSVSGFPPGVLVGTSHAGDATTAQAAIDVNNAYSYLSGMTCGPTLGTTLGGGQVLTPNVYCILASATLSGSLVLNGQGNPNSVFIIKINGGLTTAASSSVVLTNSASICNVYWQINGPFVLGVNSIFMGTALVNGAINASNSTGGAKIFGRGLSIGGAISLKANTVTVGLPPTASTITANGSTTLCAGATVTLSGNVGGSWNTGATASAITVSASGNYFVTNTTSCGSITSNTISVTVNPLPTITVNSGTICNGATITLNASGANSYTWTPGASLNSTTGTTINASPTVTTVYTITGTSAAGCSKTTTASVTVLQSPTVSVNSASICSGGSVTLVASGAATFTWSPSSGLSSVNNATVIASPSVMTVYTVTGTAGTCTSTGTSTVFINPLPTITVNSGTICAGDLVTLNANGANAFTWSPGAGLSSTTGASVNASPSIATVYTISGTSSAGCVSTQTALVMVLSNPTITVNSATVCFGNSATLTVSGANTYSWGPGADLNTTTGATVVANPTTTTVYTVTGIVGNCFSSQTTTVMVNPLPSVTIAAIGSTTFCQGGSVTLTTSSGAGYLWSDNSTTQSITVNSTGNYSATITDGNGCSATSSVISVLVNPLPTITVNNGVICNGNTATLTASGANTFTWSPGTSLSSTTGASVIASPTITTFYSISGTSPAGCVNFTIDSVMVVPNLTLVVTSATICYGNSATLTASGANSYSWGPGANLNTTTGSSVIASPTATTIYTITGTAGICTNTQTTTVVVNSLPAVTIAAIGSTTFCQGGSATLTTGSWTGYLWSDSSTTQSITVNATGNYSVTVTDINGCSATSSVISVLVNPLPTITVNSGTICSGGSIALSANGASTYTWSPGIGLSSTTGVSVTASPTATTIYTVTGTSSLGCADSVTASVVVLPNPTVTVNTATICYGNSATLTASGANSYSWGPGANLNTTTGSSVIASPTASTIYTITGTAGICTNTQTTTVVVNSLPAVTIAAIGSTTFCQGGSATLTTGSWTGYLWSDSSTTQSITVNATGNYSVTVTDINGCSATSSVISVLVNPLPTITVNSGTICSGGSIALSANGASTYSWSPGIGLSSTTGVSVTASPSITTVYTITGTGINGCTNTITTTVTVISNLTLAVNSATICFGNSATLTASGANTYSWGPGADLNATTGATVVANPTTTTVYTVTGIVGNCVSSQTTTVMVNPLPSVTIAAIGSVTFCQGGSVTLIAISGAGYLWSDNSTTQSITVNSTGNYSVTVTDGNGCSATSSVISVFVNPLPTATIGVNGSTTLCQGDNVILTASQGTSYLWSNSATTQSIMVSSSGNYTVIVTGVNGCSATSSITSVVVNIIPTPSIAVGGSTMFCQGSSATLTASGGTGYLWSTGAITPSIIVNTAGDYSVTVTNGAGCSAISEAVTISVNPSPVVNLGPDTTTCGCILLNVYNPGASYNWSSGQNYSMINVCTSGLYWVNVSNGICITTDTIKVTVNPKPVVNIAVLTGSVVVLNAGNNGSMYLWNTGATTQTIAPTTSGVFYVTVTNQFGCSGSDTTSISVAGIAGNIFNPVYLDIYPNPTYDKTFTLAFDVVQRNTIEIRIVSALGVILYNERLENFSGVYTKKLGSENMAKGIYFVEVKSRTSKTVRKIAVE